MTLLLPADLRGFPPTPAPALMKVRVHPPMSFASTSENYSLFTGLAFPTDLTAYSIHTDMPPQGFSPLRDKNNRSPPLSGFLGHLRSAHAVSHDLDGLLLQLLSGFISPHCHVQDSRFRGFPSDSVKPNSSLGRSLSTLASFASLRIAPPVPARLAPPSRRFSKSESVIPMKGFSLHRDPIPSSAFTPSGVCHTP